MSDPDKAAIDEAFARASDAFVNELLKLSVEQTAKLAATAHVHDGLIELENHDDQCIHFVLTIDCGAVLSAAEAAELRAREWAVSVRKGDA